MQSSSEDKQQIHQGILLVVTGLSIAAFVGALMKLLANDFSAYQITWMRYLGLALFMLPIAWLRFGGLLFKPARPVMQLVRGLTMVVSTVAFIIGARTVDFAEAIAILYAYPFLLTVLAVLFLGEKVHRSVWIAIVSGFAGVLLVMQPDFDSFNTGTVYIFVCAIVVALQMVLNRKLGSTSHPFITLFWGATAATLVLSTTLPFYWNSPTSEHFWLIALLVISGVVNQTMVVYAFSRADASTLAPFTYFEIIAAILLGFLIFDTLPQWISWLGIGLIVISGLYVAVSLPGRLTPRRNPKI